VQSCSIVTQHKPELVLGGNDIIVHLAGSCLELFSHFTIVQSRRSVLCQVVTAEIVRQLANFVQFYCETLLRTQLGYSFINFLYFRFLECDAQVTS
jgi:hypothetical protein